jgi:hypothetical protein
MAIMVLFLLEAGSMASAGNVQMSDQQRPAQMKTAEIQTVAFGKTKNVSSKLQWAIFVQAGGSTCALDAPFSDLLRLYPLLVQAMRDRKATLVCSGLLNATSGTYNVFFDDPKHMFQIVSKR